MMKLAGSLNNSPQAQFWFRSACSNVHLSVFSASARISLDAKHFIRFHAWRENFCFGFSVKVPFSNLSGIVWTGPQQSLVLFYLSIYWSYISQTWSKSVLSRKIVESQDLEGWIGPPFVKLHTGAPISQTGMVSESSTRASFFAL